MMRIQFASLNRLPVLLTTLLTTVLLLSACDTPAELGHDNSEPENQQLGAPAQYATGSFGWQGLSFLLESGSAIASTDELRIATEDDEHARFKVFPSSDEEIDLIFSLDAIKRGDPFVIEVIGKTDNGRPVVLSKIIHRPAADQGSVDLSHASPHAQQDAFTCRTGDESPEPINEIASMKDESTLVGTLNDWPTSFHYMRRDDVVLIEWDYERSMENSTPSTASLDLNESITTSGESSSHTCSHIGAQFSDIPSSTSLHAVRMVVEGGLKIAAPEH